jgi:hypothetical protein
MSQISKGKVALQGSGIRQRYPVFLRSGQASTIPGRLRSADSVARVPVDAHSALIRELDDCGACTGGDDPVSTRVGLVGIVKPASYRC